MPTTSASAQATKMAYEGLKAAGGKVDHIKVTLDPAEASKVLCLSFLWYKLIAYSKFRSPASRMHKHATRGQPQHSILGSSPHTSCVRICRIPECIYRLTHKSLTFPGQPRIPTSGASTPQNEVRSLAHKSCMLQMHTALPSSLLSVGSSFLIPTFARGLCLPQHTLDQWV